MVSASTQNQRSVVTPDNTAAPEQQPDGGALQLSSAAVANGPTEAEPSLLRRFGEQVAAKLAHGAASVFQRMQDHKGPLESYCISALGSNVSLYNCRPGSEHIAQPPANTEIDGDSMPPEAPRQQGAQPQNELAVGQQTVVVAEEEGPRRSEDVVQPTSMNQNNPIKDEESLQLAV